MSRVLRSLVSRAFLTTALLVAALAALSRPLSLARSDCWAASDREAAPGPTVPAPPSAAGTPTAVPDGAGGVASPSDGAFPPAVGEPDPVETSQWRRERQGGVGKATPAPPSPTPPAWVSAPTEVRPPTLHGKALVVDQAAQVLRVYEDGVQVRVLPVSTGVPPDYTPAFAGRVGYYAGTIYGYGTWADHAWYVMTARGDIYIHGAPYVFSRDGEKVYQGLEFLGVRPSSHGCIRLHPADAEWLTAWDPAGVPIVITPPDLSGRW